MNQTFRILGYLAIAMLVPSILLMKPKPRQNETESKRSPIMDLRLLLNGHFLSLAIGSIVAMTGFLPRYFLIPTSAVSKGINTDYASWLLDLMNGFSIIGRIGIGSLADRIGPVKALSTSFILCAIGHFIFWLPGVAIRVNDTGTSTALFTLFVVYTGIFGSGFISLFLVVVSYLFGREELASKTGLLNTAVGISTLIGPTAVYVIVSNGNHKKWTIGVIIAGLFMFVGGFILGISSSILKKVEKTRTSREEEV